MPCRPWQVTLATGHACCIAREHSSIALSSRKEHVCLCTPWQAALATGHVRPTARASSTAALRREAKRSLWVSVQHDLPAQVARPVAQLNRATPRHSRVAATDDLWRGAAAGVPAAPAGAPAEAQQPAEQCKLSDGQAASDMELHGTHVKQHCVTFGM